VVIAGITPVQFMLMVPPNCYPQITQITQIRALSSELGALRLVCVLGPQASIN